MVGQRGLGPCEVSDSRGETLCGTPPIDAGSSDECREDYVRWLQNQTSLEFQRTLNLSGGAGGGGGSFVGHPDHRPLGDVRVFGLAGGGGGSPAFLDYQFVQKILHEHTLNDSAIYMNFMNGNPTLYNPNLINNKGFRGYRVDVRPPLVTAGAGGGIFSDSSSFPLIQQDGRAVGRIEDFSVGGAHCVRDDFSYIPLFLREGDGGFGGGGGGCGGGGGEEDSRVGLFSEQTIPSRGVEDTLSNTYHSVKERRT